MHSFLGTNGCKTQSWWESYAVASASCCLLAHKGASLFRARELKSDVGRVVCPKRCSQSRNSAILRASLYTLLTHLSRSSCLSGLCVLVGDRCHLKTEGYLSLKLCLSLAWGHPWLFGVRLLILRLCWCLHRFLCFSGVWGRELLSSELYPAETPSLLC